MTSREKRVRDLTNSNDPRWPFQRDRDRVLYSPEFRRLSGVTQVASASEGDFFHNRLTHSLKVAQVGRRLAERLLKEYPAEVEAWSGLDPDVVETAGLAHDLGHPPFGHDGEEVIRKAVDKLGQRDGFEGNAQSFRIVTRLAAHNDNDRVGFSGLNLTRATLNAILKYPWFRGESGYRHKKWGVYDTDNEQFRWVRDNHPGEHPTLEAKLMDWADDVTYAVHDLEDFYRVRLIPIHLLQHATERDSFLEDVNQQKPNLVQEIYSSEEAPRRLEDALHSILGTMILLDTPYNGERRQRILIDSATSALITQFITGSAIKICEPPAERSLEIDPYIQLQVKLLKELTRYYVIDHPRVASIREGQKAMLRKLFEIYMDVLASRKKTLLPQATRDRLDSGDCAPRLVADLLAGMTERQVIQNYQRLTGIVPGPMSYFDL